MVSLSYIWEIKRSFINCAAMLYKSGLKVYVLINMQYVLCSFNLSSSRHVNAELGR